MEVVSPHFSVLLSTPLKSPLLHFGPHLSGPERNGMNPCLVSSDLPLVWSSRFLNIAETSNYLWPTHLVPSSLRL